MNTDFCKLAINIDHFVWQSLTMTVEKQQMMEDQSFIKGMSRKLMGIIALGSVVVLWTASGYIIKEVPAPKIFLTFYQQAHGIVLLLPMIFSMHKGETFRGYFQEVFQAMSFNKIFLFSVLFLAAQCTYNKGLDLILMTTSSILSSFSTVFTFVIGLLMLREPFLWRSALGVVVAVGGAILTICFKPEDKEAGTAATSSNPLLGSTLTLVSAALSGLNNCLMKRWLKDERYANDVFGILGLVSMVLSVPVLGIMHGTGLETFKAPQLKYFGIMSANAILGTVLSNYLLSVSLIILGPVIVAVGLTANVVLAAVVDLIREHPGFGAWYIVGMVLVMVAVVVVSIDQTVHQRRQEAALKAKLVMSASPADSPNVPTTTDEQQYP
jgi:solute carrier family 35 protein F5